MTKKDMLKFVHVNIIAENWEMLSRFYQNAFGCIPLPPKRDLSGGWLDYATGVKQAHLQGEHLKLPGYNECGPTLEIFSYKNSLERPEPAANRLGITHLAFQVQDVQAQLELVVANGGKAIGSVVSNEIPGKGTLTFVYAADPEGNLIEVQAWS